MESFKKKYNEENYNRFIQGIREQYLFNIYIKKKIIFQEEIIC